MLNLFISMPTSAAEWVFFVVALIAGLAVLALAVWMAVKLLKDGKIEQLKDAVISAIKEAERSHRSGAEKKEIVVKAAKEFCDKIGLNVNEKLLSWVADYIDRYIADHNELEEIEEQEEHL